ncbi:hypothetical protein HYR69_07305, partial [Candidatus Sumerlaeota bacterium]|nr:hypothetical protein [Candidatus Sumerlaeota bacterium]
GIWAAAALTLAALILAAELVFKWREGSDVWIFHLFAVWLSPEILTIIFAPRALMPRYYLVSVLFFMIVLVDFILRCRQWGRGGRTAALILLVLICGGNSWRVNQLIRVGRGHYLACVKYIAGHSTSPVLSIGGDHDARIALPLNYYMKYFPDRRVDYYSPHDPQPAPPEWFIAHDRGETESIPPLNPSHKLGARYELVAVYPAYGLSGMAWHLFRRVDG